MFFKIDVLKNFANYKEKHVLESFLSKSPGLQVCNFIKKRLQLRCFLVKFANFLRAPFFTEHLRGLLLKLEEPAQQQ